MQYTRFNLKAPKLTLDLFRFRIRDLLVLTLLVAVGLGSWRAYRDFQVVSAVRAKEVALQEWRQIHAQFTTSGNANFVEEEAEARRVYFQRRAAVEKSTGIAR
jgi:hypothetical protein